MLIYDASEKIKNKPGTAAMEAFLKGVYDAAEFKEEDHPRGGKGSEKGGRFVKSEKTKRKEDEDVDDISSQSNSAKPTKLEMSNHINKIVGNAVKELKAGKENPRDAVHDWIATGGVGLPNDDETIHTGNVSISGYCGTKDQFDLKVKTAKESASKAIEYLTKQTGQKWKMLAQEMYNKDGEEVKDDSSWKDCDDVTFVFGRD